MGDKQAKGGAELAARFKQYDYKAVRGCCCCRCCCCKGVQGCAWGLVRLCLHARCACVPLRIHACMRACSPSRPPARPPARVHQLDPRMQLRASMQSSARGSPCKRRCARAGACTRGAHLGAHAIQPNRKQHACMLADNMGVSQAQPTRPPKHTTHTELHARADQREPHPRRARAFGRARVTMGPHEGQDGRPRAAWPAGGGRGEAQEEGGGQQEAGEAAGMCSYECG